MKYRSLLLVSLFSLLSTVITLVEAEPFEQTLHTVWVNISEVTGPVEPGQVKQVDLNLDAPASNYFWHSWKVINNAETDVRLGVTGRCAISGERMFSHDVRIIDPSMELELLPQREDEPMKLTLRCENYEDFPSTCMGYILINKVMNGYD